MKILRVNTHKDGTRSIVINCNEITFRALLRCIRRIPGAAVTDTAHDPMNDNAKANIRYKDAVLTLETPFSDYVINCSSLSSAFDDFVSKLGNYKVKWWEKMF